MTTNHKPATPLPWKDLGQQKNTALSGFRVIGHDKLPCIGYIANIGDAHQIIGAVNAYPKLVSVLQDIVKRAPYFPMPAETFDDLGIDEAKALLRELGRNRYVDK